MTANLLPRPTFDLRWAARGLLGFVAFTEAVSGLRCLLPPPKDSPNFVKVVLFAGVQLGYAERLVAHLYALVCWLQGALLAVAAVYANLRPLTAVGLFGAVLKLAFVLIHVTLVESVTSDKNAVLLLASNVASLLALAGLIVTADSEEEAIKASIGDENEELVRGGARLLKKRKRKAD